MRKLNGLPNFFNENFIVFDDPEFRFYPDSKLTALRKGLLEYYETYSIHLKSFYDYFDEYGNSGITLSGAKGHDYLTRYFSSITFIHLSFEQFLFEILESKSPILAKLSLDKQYDIIKIFTGKINAEDVSSKKNVDYSIALARIEKLIENHNDLPPDLQLDTKYHFLSKHIETLKQLSILRNDIIHSGKQQLNRYVYECFFVNQLLPLIREYLNTQEPAIFLERNLHCKKNAIDEIARNPLPEKYGDAKKIEIVKKDLRRINHFKELGRASYHNPINMLENATTEEQKTFAEQVINKRERSRADLHVYFRQEILGHYEVHICPCCGTKSLTTFDFWTATANNKTRAQTAECAICTYKINFNIGEPKEFEIMDTELFNFIEEKKVEEVG